MSAVTLRQAAADGAPEAPDVGVDQPFSFSSPFLLVFAREAAGRHLCLLVGQLHWTPRICGGLLGAVEGGLTGLGGSTAELFLMLAEAVRLRQIRLLSMLRLRGLHVHARSWVKAVVSI